MDHRYLNRHVGGKEQSSDPDHIDKQAYLIHNQRIHPKPHQGHNRTYKPARNIIGGYHYSGEYIRPDRYHPYDGHLYEEGLLDTYTDNRIYKINYLNIDSRFRRKCHDVITKDMTLLNKNPLVLKTGSNKIFIKHIGHTYKIGDQIVMNGVHTKHIILRTKNDNGKPAFEIPKGNNFMKIYYEHGLPEEYDGSEIMVKLQNIKGNNGLLTTPYLGNIPINIINTTHILKLSLSPDDYDMALLPPGYDVDYDPEHFFVILPKTMHIVPGDPYELKNYNFKIIHMSMAGIPLNLLNANYPICRNRLCGFHTINKVTDNGYYIEICMPAVVDTIGGGANVQVAKILKIKKGFPKPNKYTIDLNKTYHDVISARLVSMEFPISEHSITNTLDKANNKIYWNDMDDGEYLYNISIPPGNYSEKELEIELEKQFLSISRINTGLVNSSACTPYHHFKVAINSATDTVSFRSYKEFILTEPIITTTPSININPVSDPTPPNNQFTLTINHKNHGMILFGDKIVINGAIEHMGIPADIINGEHTVTEIIDNNKYKIMLPKLNLNDIRVDTKGGVAVTIFVPDMFRLHFDKSDTLGEVLGFHNPNSSNSITSYNSYITNKDPYKNNVIKHCKKPIKHCKKPIKHCKKPIKHCKKLRKHCNKPLRLRRHDYVLMVAKPIITLHSLGPIKNAFAKILLCDEHKHKHKHKHKRVICNSFVPTSRYYDQTLHELSELKIAFFTPDGKLYDFNCVDHSFTIEIITMQDLPNDTGISSYTGRNFSADVQRVKNI
uniref:Putative minor capsid protein n=1 Tax=Mimivirus LCMiAC01 TaxID=2506608 RepID=A0A481Z0W8_9VIRU|nr:MAG: putative minor capsid protein [Mimivirus LCMiAC01]